MFRLANVAGRAALVDGDHWYDIATLSGGNVGPDPMDAVAAHSDLHDLADRLADADPGGLVSEAHLGPPVPRPRNCLAIGLNYQEHVEESGMDAPAAPVVFTKFPSCIVGPDDDIELRSGTADYEAELVVVIGEGGRDIAVEHAWSRVAGVTGGQDVSDRMLQFAAKPPHFDLGKSRDTYGPLGPLLVSPDCFADADDIELSCSVNGDERQRSSTRHLIFGVPELIRYLSSIMTLGPGDVIFTGTPEGVGATTGTFLAAGDVVVTELAGIGTMTNRCV